ncbi:unnamed protein product [Prorocentrum cordatum]|uniref:Protein kinase domain-containing protein n=1 Tax=Prorocentrum cordatum TaxID=2364126 RepID=A0ABN9S956_9DINO|nr:unnamed protein product [Polarella glacialis]
MRRKPDVDLAVNVFGADLLISRDELVLGESIGSGSVAEVFYGSWRGTEVAVKQQPVDDAMDVVIMRELSVMARNEHPNLVRLLGFCHGGPTFDLVLELCRGGALFNLLHLSERQISMRQWPPPGVRSHSRLALRDSSSFSSSAAASLPPPGVEGRGSAKLFAQREARAQLPLMRQQLKLAEDVSEGMAYLHRQTPQIMHRDLKSLNVLLHEPVTSLHDVPLAKVTDFGLARARGGPRCWAQSAPQATLQLQERWRPRRHSRSSSCPEKLVGLCRSPEDVEPLPWIKETSWMSHTNSPDRQISSASSDGGLQRNRPCGDTLSTVSSRAAGDLQVADTFQPRVLHAPPVPIFNDEDIADAPDVLVNGVHVAVPVLDAWGPPVHPLPTRATSPSFGTSRCSTPQSPEEPWSQLASEANQSSRAKQISSSSICSDSSRYTAVSRLTSRIGSVQWMSPELLLGGENYTSKVDVYAYGMLVYEIFFFEPPFVEFEPDEVESAVLAGVRPDIGCDDVPEQMLRLMRACWHHDAERRPTFEALRCALASFREHDADAFEAFLSP